MNRFAFFFILLSSTAFSQPLDTLLHLLETKYVQEDTMRGICLGKIAMAYIFVDSAKSEAYCDELLKLSKKTAHRNMEAEAYLLKGHLRKTFLNCKGAIPLYQKANDIYMAENFRPGIAMMFDVMGGAYRCLSDFEKAKDALEKGLKMASELKDSSQIANCYNNLGSLYFQFEQHEKALEYTMIAYNMRDKYKMEVWVAQTINNVAAIHIHLGNYDEAIKFQSQALNLALSLGNKKLEADSYSNLGQSYEYKGDFPIALQYYQKALAIQKEVGNKEGVQLSYTCIADVISEQGDYEGALEYYEKALAICQELEDDLLIAHALNNISTVYKDRKDYGTAESYLSKAEVLYDKINSHFGRGVIASSRGEIAYKLGQYQEALDQYLTMLSAYEKGERHDRIPASMVQVAEAYLKLDKQEDALPYLQKALSLAESSNEKDVQMDAHKHLSDIMEKKGEIEKAYEHQKAFHKFYNDIYNEKNSIQLNKAISQLNIERQKEKLEKQEAQLKLQQAKNKTHKILLLFSGVLLAILSVFLWAFHSRNKKLKKQKEQIEKQKDKIDKLLTYVEHNTKNQLTQLVALINIQDRQLSDDSEAKPILKASKGRLEAIKNLHLQLLKQPAGSNAVLLKPYLENTVKNIFSTFENDLSQKIKTEINIDDVKMDMNTAGSIGLILNEIITNAFKHGINGTNENPSINIEALKKENNLLLKISDNGTGFPEGFEKNGHNTFGVELIKALTANCGGTVSFSNSPGACYEINVPIS